MIEALRKFLNEETEAIRANLQANLLRSAELFFIVTKKGTIENVYLDSTLGYADVDKTMKELINKARVTCESAQNTKGKKVDQELVV